VAPIEQQFLGIQIAVAQSGETIFREFLFQDLECRIKRPRRLVQFLLIHQEPVTARHLGYCILVRTMLCHQCGTGINDARSLLVLHCPRAHVRCSACSDKVTEKLISEQGFVFPLMLDCSTCGDSSMYRYHWSLRRRHEPSISDTVGNVWHAVPRWDAEDSILHSRWQDIGHKVGLFEEAEMSYICGMHWDPQMEEGPFSLQYRVVKKQTGSLLVRSHWIPSLFCPKAMRYVSSHCWSGRSINAHMSHSQHSFSLLMSSCHSGDEDRS
jgi:hypothetical protein